MRKKKLINCIQGSQFLRNKYKSQKKKNLSKMLTILKILTTNQVNNNN